MTHETCICEQGRDEITEAPSRSDKRDLSISQKRPIYPTKETYISDKRDLYIRQKRPIYPTKETYISHKINVNRRVARHPVHTSCI